MENQKKNQNTNNKLELIDYIIGDRKKWKKMPIAFKQLSEDLKTNKKWNLLMLFALWLCIMYGSMMGVRWVQNNAQYCEVIIADANQKRISENNIYTYTDEKGNEQKITMIQEPIIDINLTIEKTENEALPIPKSGENWAYYLDYYKNGRKQPWVGFNCTWDLERFYNEELSLK